MPRYPLFLKRKQVPDTDVLRQIKLMIKDGKGPKKMKEELPNISMCAIIRYYSKVRRGIW